MPIKRSFEVVPKGGKKGQLAGWFEVPFETKQRRLSQAIAALEEKAAKVAAKKK